MIRLTIPITPAGQERPRHRVMHRKGKKPIATTYKSTKQRSYEERVCSNIKSIPPWRRFVNNEPLELRVECHMPVPRSWPKWKKEKALQGKIHPTSTPDLSNMIKNIEDCVQGLAFKNDKQIVQIAAVKKYSENPRWEVTINELRG